MRFAACTLIATLLSATAAAAAPIVTYNFVGEVALGSLLPAGTSISFSVPFDYGAADRCQYPGQGVYLFGGSTVSYGGSSFTSTFTDLEVNNAECSLDVDYLIVRMLNFGAPFYEAELILPGTDSEAIPILTPPLTAGFVLLPSRAGGNDILAQGFARLVPEPASSALLIVAAGAMMSRYRMSRARRGED